MSHICFKYTTFRIYRKSCVAKALRLHIGMAVVIRSLTCSAYPCGWHDLLGNETTMDGTSISSRISRFLTVYRPFVLLIRLPFGHSLAILKIAHVLFYCLAHP